MWTVLQGNFKLKQTKLQSLCAESRRPFSAGSRHRHIREWKPDLSRVHPHKRAVRDDSWAGVMTLCRASNFVSKWTGFPFLRRHKKACWMTLITKGVNGPKTGLALLRRANILKLFTAVQKWKTQLEIYSRSLEERFLLQCLTNSSSFKRWEFDQTHFVWTCSLLAKWAHPGFLPSGVKRTWSGKTHSIPVLENKEQRNFWLGSIDVDVESSKICFQL